MGPQSTKFSDVVRPSFEANPHDLKSREGARGVQSTTLGTDSGLLSQRKFALIIASRDRDRAMIDANLR